MKNLCDSIAEEVWVRLLGLSPEETEGNYDQEGFARYLERVLPPLTVLLNYCTINAGDGSAYPAFFKTRNGAEAREEYETEEGGFCEASGQAKLSFTLKGELVQGNDYIELDSDWEEVYE